MTYDPDLWAVTTDQMGFSALAHRNITACIITPSAGRGLPADTTVAHDILDTGKVTYDVSVVSENGVKSLLPIRAVMERSLPRSKLCLTSSRMNVWRMQSRFYPRSPLFPFHRLHLNLDVIRDQS